MVIKHSQNYNIDHHPISSLICSYFKPASTHPELNQVLENYNAPKICAVGAEDAEGNFIQTSQLNPHDALRVKIKFVADEKDVKYLIEYTDPNQKTFRRFHTIIPDWTTYTTSDHLERPMTSGMWTVRLKNAKGDQTYFTLPFEVSDKYQLHSD